jgi:hypothetical protein
MARSQLNQQLTKEFTRYLGIPYYINRPGQFQQNNVYAGKGNIQQIIDETKRLAKQQGLDYQHLSAKQIYLLQKKHHIGIDCSGLAYHLADFYHQLLFDNSIEPYLVGTDNKRGVRRLSAHLLTSPPNSLPISSYSSIRPLDFIRLRQGRHVAVIVGFSNNLITYLHNSRHTKIRGVHLATIQITDPAKPLNLQKWSESSLSGKNYSSSFSSANGDGIFRLKVFA